MSETPSSQIDKEARILLRKWTRCQYYVYLRPLDYRFYNPTAEFEVHWKVTVEYRGLGFKQHVAEGMNLSEVIKKLGEEVPINKPKLKPRASVPRPTETRRIVSKIADVVPVSKERLADTPVKMKRPPGKLKVSKKFIEDNEADAAAMPENGITKKRKKKGKKRARLV